MSTVEKIDYIKLTKRIHKASENGYIKDLVLYMMLHTSLGYDTNDTERIIEILIDLKIIGELQQVHRNTFERIPSPFDPSNPRHGYKIL